MSRKIIIWDDKPLRAARIRERLIIALQKLNRKADIVIQSEPPLLARENLNDKIPAIEAGGKYWHKGMGKEPDQEDIIGLIQKLFSESTN